MARIRTVKKKLALSTGRRTEVSNNADIRPWISVAEATSLALSKIIEAKRESDSRA